MMYCKHYGLTQFVHNKDLPPEDAFLSVGLKEYETRLFHGVELKTICMFTAHPGAGKTYGCRRAMSRLHPSLYRVIYIPNCNGNVPELYKSIATAMGLVVPGRRGALYCAIKDEVTRLCLESKLRPVIILDDAHFLRNDVLEELRLLTNFDMDGVDRMCVILLGHPELRRRMALSMHEALNQRIVVRYQVQGLARTEVAPFLSHILRKCGTELQLFDESAVEALHQATGGLPRKLTKHAHHALNAAALQRAKQVTAEHVLAATPEVE